MRRVTAAAGLAAALALAASALAAPLTGDVLVNEDAGELDQLVPRVAHQPGGSFLVAWEDTDPGSDPTLLDHGQVLVRRFDASGVGLTAETPVPEAADDDIGESLQERPDIDTAPDGSAVVVWEDFRPAEGPADVLARLVTATGAPAGDTITVATGAGSLSEPTVAVSPDNSFTVAWSTGLTAGTARDVFLRRFDAGGNPLTDAVPVAVGTGEELSPDVAALPDGTLVVVHDDETIGDAFARRYAASGAPLGSVIPVGTDPAAYEDFPAVDGDSGGFTVVWDKDDDLVARRFDANGQPTSPERQVNVSEGMGIHSAASIATAPDGRAAIAWNGDGSDVPYLRQFTAAMEPISAGDEDATAGDYPARPNGVAADGDRFTVVWQATEPGAPDTENDVFARRFDWDADAVSPPPPPPPPPPPAPPPPPPPPPPPSPLPPPPPTPLDPQPLFKQLVKLPAAGKCVKGRKLRIRLVEPAGTEIVKATLKVKGKKKATRSDGATVVLRKLPKKGRFTVSVQVVTTEDGTLSGKRRYKACT